MAIKTQAPTHPIFEKYSINELAKKGGYSESHILAMKAGYTPVSRKFRILMAAVLNKKEMDLFTE